MFPVVRVLLIFCLLGPAVAIGAGAARGMMGGPPFAIDFLYGRDELFPSALVCLTGNSSFAPRDPAQLGDPAGVISARLVAPAQGSTVRVTVAATPFFAESSVAVTIDTSGECRIAPTIRFNNEKLAAVKQPVANLVVKVTVKVDDGAPRDEYRRVVVHSIHDCITSYRLRGLGPPVARAAGLVAAYANENHPAIDQTITKNALTEAAGTPADRPQRLVRKFEGYLPQQNWPLPGVNGYLPLVTSQVRTEVRAIYDSLQRLHIGYADLGSPSVGGAPDGARVETRSIRLVGEIVESRQANGLEVALVMASVLRKLSVDTAIYLLPGNRALLGVYLTPGRNPAHRLVLDPQFVGSKKTFDEAVDLGAEAYNAARALLEPQVERAVAKAPPPLSEKAGAEMEAAMAGGYVVIDLEDARMHGILPIADPR